MEEKESEERSADARKGRKAAKHFVFPMICGSGGSKSRLAKAAGAEPAGQRRMKNCMPLWREAHFQVKMYKAHQLRPTFGSCAVEKVHAVVARSTFGFQNVQNTPGPGHFWKLRCRKSARSTFRSQNVQNTRDSDHFWKLRCRKSARRCGAKHISKSKCTKHPTFGPLLEVEMSKKCTPLWREAHVPVNMLKTPRVRTPFGSSDVEKVHAVVVRSTFRSQHVKTTRGSDQFWRFRCCFAWQAQRILHLVKSEQNVRILKHFQLQPPLHHTTLQYIALHYNYNYTFTTFYYTTLHYTPLHYTALNYTQLPYTTLHYTTLDYTTLH